MIRPVFSKPAGVDRVVLHAAAASLVLAGLAAPLQAASLFSLSEVYPTFPDAEDYELLCEDAGASQSSCTGTYAFEGSELNYQTSAESQFGVLKAAGAASIIRTGDSSGLSTGPESFDVFSSSSFRDQWTISGLPAGSTGTLSLAFQLTGAWDFGSANAGISNSFGMFVYGQGSIDADPLSFGGDSGLLSQTVILETPFTFGTEIDFSVFLGAGSFLYDLQDGGFDGQGSFLDLSNTAVMTAIVVADSEGNILPAFSLSTSSGAELFDGLAVVPVPAALPLFLSSLAGLVFWRRRACA